MSERLKNILIPCAIFLFFFSVYSFVRPYHQGGYTVGYSDFPMLICRAAAGEVRFGPAIERLARESLGGNASDVYTGHQLYVPLTVLAYSAFKPLFPSGGYRVAGALLSALLASGGAVLFYGILKRAGKELPDRLFGVLFLGFSWYYSQNAHNNDACMHAALSVLAATGAYLWLSASRPTVVRLSLFWLLFALASLLYMNTVPLVPVFFIIFALRYPTLKDIAAFLVTGFAAGLGALYGLSYVILSWMSARGMDIMSTDLFGLLACYNMWMKSTILMFTEPMYAVPVYLCQKIGELFLPPHHDILAFVSGLIFLYVVGYVMLFMLIRRQRDWSYWLFAGCVIAYASYFIVTKYIFSSRIFMACIVPVSYLVTDGFSRARRGELPLRIDPPTVKRVGAGVVCLFAAVYVLYAARPQLAYGETFCSIPSRDASMVSPQFFEWIERNTEADSFIVYDSGYIDRVLGGMLMVYSGRFGLINYTPNIAFLGGARGANLISGNRLNVPLAEIVAGRGGTPVYLLATHPDVDRIAVPLEGTLGGYCLFARKGVFGKWGLFTLTDGAKVDASAVNDALGGGDGRCASIEAGRWYFKRPVHWERLSIPGLAGTTLVLVPTADGAGIDTKERYLCYW